MPAHLLVPVIAGLGLTGVWALTTAPGKLWLNYASKLLTRKRGHRAFLAIHSNMLTWVRNRNNQHAVTYFMKPLLNDTGSGQRVMLVRYPAGQINPLHSHSHGHGIYVLQGTMVTHRGSFGPDTFVWFPPGEVMTHGAGDDAELVALFITGGDLETKYVPQSPTSAPLDN